MADQLFRAILFDLGNVLIKFSFDQTFEKWAEMAGHSAELFRNRFQYDNQMVLFEKGLITPKTYWEHVVNMVNVPLTYEDFCTGWDSIFLGLAHNAILLVENLKQKYRLFILTNTNILHAQGWRSRYPDLLAHFEGIYSSYELHAHKPDPMIFQKVLDLIKFPASQVLFVDDKRENIEGAAEMGIKGLLIANPDNLEKELSGAIQWGTK